MAAADHRSVDRRLPVMMLSRHRQDERRSMTRPSIGILDDYQRVALTSADWSGLAATCDIRVIDRPIDPEHDLALLQSFDILCAMRERTPFPRALIAQLPRLTLLVTTGAGNNAIDLAAAKEHGVLVCGTGNGEGRRATAELAWGLILAAARHIPEELRRVREGDWQGAVGKLLWGRTLGLCGLGHIGAMLAGYGLAFGMEVIAWSENLQSDRAAALGVRRVEREELFARADVLSVHQVLSDRTRASIGAAEFATMKSNAIFVNTSRGPIVDETALLAALDGGQIGAAALDTYVQEPLPHDHPFRQHPRIVASPHIGYVEEEVYRIFFGDTVAAIEAFLAGNPPARLLNPPHGMLQGSLSVPS